MTLTNSEAVLKSKTKRGSRFFLAATLGLVLLILSLGPTLLLQLMLKSTLPPESGLTLTYEKAQAGFLFLSAEITGLTINSPGQPATEAMLSIEALTLDGLAPLNLLTVLRNSYIPAEKPLFLAKEARLTGLSAQTPGRTISASKLGFRDISLAPTTTNQVTPITFAKMEIKDVLALFQKGPQTDQIKIAYMDARNLNQNILGNLTTQGLSISLSPVGNQPAHSLEIGGFNLGGLQLEALRRTLAGEKDGLQIIWSLLAGCDTLDLGHTVLNRAERETLNIKSALFDSSPNPGGTGVNYLRRLDCSIDLEALAASSPDPFWLDLKALAGNKLQLELVAELLFNPAPGQTELKSLRLESPNLGCVDISTTLSGISPLKAHHNPAQLLLSTNAWRLHKMQLTFTDAGFMANYYRYLDRTAFKNLPNRDSAANIKHYVIDPLALELEKAQGLANLPALVSEVDSFFKNPSRFQISAAPEQPMPLSLWLFAKQDEYDILEKLRLTLEVNNRAPVSIAVAAGVFHDRLPSAPRPLDNFFEEDL